MSDGRTWWIGFAVFSTVVLGGLALAGAIDRDRPGILVEDGGLVSDLTDGAWLLAFGLAAAVAVRESRGRRPARAWILVSALAALGAWEESEWTIRGMEARDLHNPATLALARRFGPEIVLVLAILLVVAVPCLVAWVRRRPGGMGAPIVPHVTCAAGLLGVAVVMDVAWEAGMPYVAGQWVLEEGAELLAAVAVLGAPVRALAARRGVPDRRAG